MRGRGMVWSGRAGLLGRGRFVSGPFVSAGLVHPGGGFRRMTGAFGGRRGVVFVSFSPFFNGIFDPFLFFNPFVSRPLFNPFFARPFFNPFFHHRFFSPFFPQPFFNPFFPGPFFFHRHCIGGFGGCLVSPFAFNGGFVPFVIWPFWNGESEFIGNNEQSGQATTGRGQENQSSQPEEDQFEIAPEQSPGESPPTVLMFRDHSWIEVKTYTIIGDYLYEYDPRWIRKIRLSDLDMPETIRYNAERGIDFRVPQTPR